MHNEQCTPCGKFISWHAIVGGALVAIGLTFLFNLLTAAIGLSLFSPDHAGKHIMTFGGFAWILIGIYVILFIAGWVSGRTICYKYSLRCGNGLLHGFLMWTVYLILSFFVLSHLASDSTAFLIKSSIAQAHMTSEATPASSEANSHDAHAVKPRDAHAPKANEMDSTQGIHILGIATFATFFIFLFGAIGACVGACYGIKAAKKCKENSPM